MSVAERVLANGRTEHHGTLVQLLQQVREAIDALEDG